MATITLFPHQVDAIEAIDKARADGRNNIPVVMATGTGKTTVFSEYARRWIADNPGKRALIIVHTDELAEQAARRLRLMCPGVSVGVMGGGKSEHGARIVVAYRQTLASERKRNLLRKVGLIIIDECFPAGTIVGGRAIETLKPGDFVPAWDERTGQVVQSRVIATGSKRPEHMVKVSLADGRSFACTPNHPILTAQGWCPAGMLLRNELVVSFTHDAVGDMHMVQGDVRHLPRAVSPQGDVEENGTCVRHAGLPNGVGEAGQRRSDASHAEDSGSDQRGQDAGEQPDGQRGDTREDGGHLEADRAQAPSPRWERARDARASAQAGGAPRLATGANRRAIGRGAPASLQVGHSSSDDEGVRGGGRGIPFLAGAPKLRSSQGRAPVETRVVDVQVLEPGCDGTYGGVCPDGLVYDIEVDSTHTFLVGEGTGVVAHNCHFAVRTNTYGRIVEHFESQREPPLVLGFTATLARGDKQKLSTLWSEPCFTYDILSAIRAGFLLDVAGERVIVPDLNMGNVKTRAGDYSADDIADELERTFAPEVIANEYVRLAKGRRGLAFWPLVETAYHGERAFTAAGIRSGVVHGALPKPERREMLRRFALSLEHPDAIEVMHNAVVLTVGFDEPSADIAVIARPTKSKPLYQQMVGRVLRPDLTIPARDRQKALVLDVTGAGAKNDLATLIDLSPEIPPQDEYDETLSLLELDEAIAEELAEQRAGATYTFDSDEYLGPADTLAFDPLAREKVWNTTADGHHFISVGDHGLVFLAPSMFDSAGWDVVICSQYEAEHQFLVPTEHVALPLDMALNFGEGVAELANGGFGIKTLTERKAPWRRRPASISQKNWAKRLGLKFDEDSIRKGELSDLIDTVLASRRIDPIVEYVTALRDRQLEQQLEQELL